VDICTSDTTRTNTTDNVVSQYSHDMNLLPWPELEPELLTFNDIDMVLRFCCDILSIDKHVKQLFFAFIRGLADTLVAPLLIRNHADLVLTKVIVNSDPPMAAMRKTTLHL
jgi:hypothetical protein